MAYNPNNPNGRAAAVDSEPVVLSNEDKAALDLVSTKLDGTNQSLGGQSTVLASIETKIGSVTETAPASDTASSGLNGRLQRIAQRITSLIAALGFPFQAGGSIGNTSFGVNNAGGINAVNIQDGGNSITVDGPLTDSQLRAAEVQVHDADVLQSSLNIEASALDIENHTGQMETHLISLVSGTKIKSSSGADIVTDVASTGLKIVAVDGAGAPIYAPVITAGGKGSTLKASPTSTDAGANRQPLDVILRDSSGAEVSIGGGGNVTILNSKLTDFRNASVDLVNASVNSLASGSCAISDRITNLRSVIDILIHYQAEMANTAPSSDKAIYVWLLAWYHDGTTWTHSDIGSSTAASTTSAAITLGATHNLHLLGIMNYTTADQKIVKSFSMAKTFGPTLPDGFSIITENKSGAAFAASGSSLKYREIYQKTIA